MLNCEGEEKEKGIVERDFFLLWQNIDNIKFTLLTMFKFCNIKYIHILPL